MQRICGVTLSIRFLAPVVLAAVAASTGCVSESKAPEPERVSPAKGFQGEERLIEITGDGMYPLVLANAAGDGGQVDRSFDVALLRDGAVEQELRGVHLLEANRLEATVPPGLELGRYDLRVTDPQGRTGELADAYQVTSSRVDRVSVTVGGVDATDLTAPFRINRGVTFDVQLFDDAGARVLESIPLDISVYAIDGFPVDGELTSSMPGARDTGSGLGLDLDTSVSGVAEFGLDVFTPTEVVVVVSSPDGDLGLDDVAVPMGWVAGNVYDVQIDLPSAQFSTLAGSGFNATLTLIDRENRVVVDDPEFPVDATLYDSCGDLAPVRLDDFSGAVTVPVELTVATGGSRCPEQRLRVALEGDEHTSRPIQVRSREFAGFSVDLADSEAVAGQPMQAVVSPVDSFGNPVPWDGDSGTLEVFDSIADVNTIGCGPGSNLFVCTVTPTDADDRVFLTVREPVVGAQGVSSAYLVGPGPVDRMTVEPHAGDLASGIVAGRPFQVTVHLYDEFGNDVNVTEAQAREIDLESTFDDARCSLFELGERGEAEFQCTLTVAYDGVSLTGAVSGTQATSSPFAVVNGELAEVRITVPTTDLTAGDPFTLSLEGVDAWGNPYKAQSDPVVALLDTSSTLSVPSVALDTSGRASASATLEQAGVTFIIAERSGMEVGRSLALDVQAAAPAALAVEPEMPWAWSGGTLDVLVSAVDRYGNLADSSEQVTVTASVGTFNEVVVDLAGGQATAELSFDDTSRSETIGASGDSGITGKKAGFVVAADCGTGGPTVSLSFGSNSDAIACHDGESANIDASFSGSADATGGSPALYGLWVDGEGGLTTGASAISMTGTRIGVSELRGLVVDDDDCATEVLRKAWVGRDDGQPVGPIDVSLSSTSLEVGVDKTTISLNSATTCDGDAASGADVYVRSDRGGITGVTSSGSGLELTLDSSGNATATLDLTADETGGDGVVTAWVASGAALGLADFEVTGDTARPRVLAQDPVGYAEGDYNVIELIFDEPLDSDTVTQSAFSVSGPDPVTIESVLLTGGNRVVEVWLDNELTAEDGRWTVTAAAGITDAAGNGLDGGWSSSSGVHRAVFGDVAATAATVSSCAPTTTTLRPDGDTGSSSDEADAVSFSAVASRTPTRWVVDVRDDSNARVWHQKLGATGKSATLTWTARDLTDRVVPDGDYTVTIYGQNIDGTLGTGCASTVKVDNDRD